MNVFTLDFETYYDKEYSLSRMSTEEYVYDDRFEIIMVSLKVNDEETVWFSAETEEEYKTYLMSHGVHRGAVIAHNLMFDGLILQRLGIPTPPMLLDTLSMAQAVLKPHHRSISLDSCLKHLNSPIRKKGYVHNMIGRRLASLSLQELRDYADYCVTDTDGTHWLFHSLKSRLPKSEYEIIDTTLRMYLEPAFDLDEDILRGLLTETREKKRKLLEALPDWCKKSQLSSNPQFAKVLEDKLGIEPPLKISPTTGKTTFAFAKNDEAWKDLEDEWGEDPIVGPILAARLGVKSTIAETRAERFLTIAEDYGKLRVPLRYYGAHTGRYGGMEKINCQNLSRITYGEDGKPSSPNQLRFALKAPPGHKVVAIDLSQIEARINAWLAGCHDLLQVFHTGGDPYCAFATKLYRRPITKADKAERFVGKTCILGLGYGMGAKKLKASFRKDGHKLPLPTAYEYVNTYRDVYHEIPANWRFCDHILGQIHKGGLIGIGPCTATKDRITLPNGMAIWYNDVRYIENRKYKGWVFDYAGKTKMIWGGTVVENLCQALARIILMEHASEIRQETGQRPKLNVHDELVYVVPESIAEDFLDLGTEIMHGAPDWAEGLPVAAEGSMGQSYGECK
jgi:DNA polymerase